MTDPASPPVATSNPLRTAYDYLSSGNLVVRVLVLALLTLGLKIPQSLLVRADEVIE